MFRQAFGFLGVRTRCCLATQTRMGPRRGHLQCTPIFVERGDDVGETGASVTLEIKALLQ